MGFSTNITIQNDFWHRIEEDPQALVDAISLGMNDGAGGSSPLIDALDSREDAPDYRKRRMHERRYRHAPQGVTVHRAQHNDVPQVIVSTYGSHAIAAHEIPYAVENGWLDLSDYNEKHAEAIAKELTKLARDIRKAVKRAKEKRSAQA